MPYFTKDPPIYSPDESFLYQIGESGWQHFWLHQISRTLESPPSTTNPISITTTTILIVKYVCAAADRLQLSEYLQIVGAVVDVYRVDLEVTLSRLED